MAPADRGGERGAEWAVCDLFVRLRPLGRDRCPVARPRAGILDGRHRGIGAGQDVGARKHRVGQGLRPSSHAHPRASRVNVVARVPRLTSAPCGPRTCHHRLAMIAAATQSPTRTWRSPRAGRSALSTRAGLGPRPAWRPPIGLALWPLGRWPRMDGSCLHQVIMLGDRPWDGRPCGPGRRSVQGASPGRGRRRCGRRWPASIAGGGGSGLTAGGCQALGLLVAVPALAPVAGALPADGGVGGGGVHERWRPGTGRFSARPRSGLVRQRSGGGARWPDRRRLVLSRLGRPSGPWHRPLRATGPVRTGRTGPAVTVALPSGTGVHNPVAPN